MKRLNDFDFNKKRVILRGDLDVSFFKDKEISDDYRIKTLIPTINYLLEKDAKIVLIGHFGDSDNHDNQQTLIAQRIQDLLGEKIVTIKDCIGPEVEEMIGDSSERIFLLGNLRNHSGEQDNCKDFRQDLSRLGEIYVNDAFAVCHREHASIVGLPELLPSCSGIRLNKEIEILGKAIKEPQRPLVIIVGGAKVSSKIKYLDKFLEISDHLLLGGKLANEILAIKGIIKQDFSLPEDIVDRINQMQITSPKAHLPIDLIASATPNGESSIKVVAPAKAKDDEGIFDIGPETIDIYSKIIKEAKTIIWSGPLGLFEKEPFEKGTKEIIKAIADNKEALTIAGGGDTGASLTKFNQREAINHISTGGGAMLEFLSGSQLAGLKALNYYND